MQTFQYPNLLTGTRSGAGWELAGGRPAVVSKSAYGYGPVLPCYNSAATETCLWSAPVTLRAGTDYVLSFLAACTDNTSGFDVHVLDTDATYPGWIGAEMYTLARPGGGVAGTPCPSGSRRRLTTARRTAYGSTTTGARTARTRSYGSRTPCSARARSRTRGRLRRGRCGLSER